MPPNTNRRYNKSYEKINYTLRPAKAAERKMLCETFSKLSFFNKIEKYRYIGFGSPFFSDFSLFHRGLGINSMICIEKNKQDQSRFEFNKPYKCIELIFGTSNEILPTLSWNIHTILWLDYDGLLNQKVLEDINLFCFKAKPGSIIIVTVNAHEDYLSCNENKVSADDEIYREKYRMEKLKEQVGLKRIPPGIKGIDLSKKNKSKVLRTIINREILDILLNRNGGLSNDEKIIYKQLFNFTYEDNAKMLTVGGILYETSQEKLYEECGLENLEYIRTNEDEYNIRIPSLTFREIKFLDKQIPLLGKDGEKLDITKVDFGELKELPKEDIESYIKIYRYFPNFIESEI